MERQYTVREMTQVVEGALFAPPGMENTWISEVKTDSREDLSGAAFFALAGEKMDGHDFLEAAREQHAVAFVVHQEEKVQAYKDFLPVILVQDTEKALRSLARAYRDELGLKVVAVTGSVGKTSTRDTIAQALSGELAVHQTRENLNNNFGVPFTLLATPKSAEVAVIECGMDRPGKIRLASEASHPDIAVITNIGTSHIEKLGSRQGILAAKAEILSALKPGGTLVVNGEDPYLLALAEKEAGTRPLVFVTSSGQAGSLRTILAEDQALPEATEAELMRVAKVAAAYDGENRFGLPSGTVLRAADVEESAAGMSFTLLCDRPGKAQEVLPAVRLVTPGLQQLHNALVALAVAKLLGLDVGRAANQLRELRLTSGRQQVEELGGGSLLIDDTYNASPESMRAAFHLAGVLAQNPSFKKRVLFLGGVNELGSYAEVLHKDIGLAAGKSHFDEYLLLGPWAETMAAGIREVDPEASIETFAEQEEILALIAKASYEDTVFLVKASRGYRMETICRALRVKFPRTRQSKA